MDASIDTFELKICKGPPFAPQGITIVYTATAGAGITDLAELWKAHRPQILAKPELDGYELAAGEDVTLMLQRRALKATLKFRPAGSAAADALKAEEAAAHDNLTRSLIPKRVPRPVPRPSPFSRIAAPGGGLVGGPHAPTGPAASDLPATDPA